MGISRRVPAVLGYLGMVGGVGLATLVAWVAHPNRLVTTALVYLLTVFVGALLWGRGPAILGSVLATLALDYFFVPPIFSLGGATPFDTISLIVFLVVTDTTSRLVAEARAQAREAETRAREAQALFRISEAIAGAESADATLRTVAELTVHLFRVRSCAILLRDATGALKTLVSVPAGSPSDITREESSIATYALHHHTPVPDGGTLYMPVSLGAERLGVFRIGPGPDGLALPAGEQRLLRACVDAAAVAIDRRRLREAASQAEVLRRSDELKTALLSSVSHDLRTPLATIKTGITALLDELTWDPQAQREVLTAANEEVDRLTRLIGNLLDLSRIEAGALAPDRQWYEIGEVITNAIRRATGRLRDHLITSAISRGDLPLFVDYVEIQQVLANLLENAARFSPAGAEIHLSTAVEDDVFVIRIRDHGPGIPRSESERIFSKFYRIDRRGGGTGLGLAISRGLVEAHGGQIVVENPGQPGAIFAVSIPITKPPAPSEVPV